MPNGEWNFEISRIALNDLAIDAGRPLGLVLAQPRYELQLDGAVPFHIATAYREHQLEVIKRSFLIRRIEAESRGIPISFIVLPEYSIPVTDPDGLQLLQDEITAYGNNVVFVAGLEGLTQEELRLLVNRYRPSTNDALPSFNDGAFVNTCVVVIKDNAGRISWHFQAKLAPSQWEESRGMATGKIVLYFQGDNVSFLCQICFDQIAMRGDAALSSTLCGKLQDFRSPDGTSLDLIFVPQYNEQPTTGSFPEHASTILRFEHRLFNAYLTTLVAVNRAADNQEPGKFGCSGIHCRDGRWQSQKKITGPNGYRLTAANRVTSAIFRKRTEAIHTAEFFPPTYNLGDPGNPRLPLQNVRSYLLSPGCDTPTCPCLPGDTSDAGNYVRCLPLPCTLRDSLITRLPERDIKRRWQSADHTHPNRFVSHYATVREGILSLATDRVSDILDLLFFSLENGKGNPDLWEIHSEKDAVVELAAILSILREGAEITLDTRRPWTAEFGAKIALVVIDGGGNNNCLDLGQQYIRAYESEYYKPENRKRTMLIVAQRSTGRVDPIVMPFDYDITSPKDRTAIGDDDTPFKARRAEFYLCREDFLQEIRADTSGTSLLNREMEKILE